MYKCTICYKEIRKKDWFRVSIPICSIECDQERKKLKPKKVGVLSVSYWMSKGMSEVDAKNKVSSMQKLRSPRCIEHWIKKGFSVDQAVQKVSEVQKLNGKQNQIKYSKKERSSRSPFCVEYWINKGCSVIDAKQIIKNNSSTISLRALINRYGEADGTRKYNEICEHRKKFYTLDGYISKYGNELGNKIWKSKFKNRPNSKKANDFFKELISIIPENIRVYSAMTSLGEYGINTGGEYYFYDFVVPDINLCVEFNGDYWHCNPKKYLPEYVHKQSGKTAKEIQEKDKRKHNFLKELRNIDTYVIWESESKEQMPIIKELIKDKLQKKE